METYKLSPHTLNLYTECPRCFWEEAHGKKRPSGPFPSLPSGMDKIIKQRFDAYRRKREVPEELASRSELALFPAQKLLNSWRRQRGALAWQDENSNTLAGSLDDVLQTVHEELVVLDYKTRGFPLKTTPDYYTLQLECYTLLLQKLGFSTTGYALLLFYSPDSFTEQGTVRFNSQLVEVPVYPDHAEETFQAAVQALDGRKPKADKKCAYCAWRES